MNKSMIQGNVFQSKARDYLRGPRPAGAVPVHRLPAYVNLIPSAENRRIKPTETGKKASPLDALSVDHCQD
jgi:hypothetical protein